MSNKYMRKIVKFEDHTEVEETERITFERSYADGGKTVEVTITKRSTTRPAALLECGHWRMNDSNSKVLGKKLLSCHECQMTSYALRQAV